MKKALYISLILMSFGISGIAQQQVAVRLDNRPMSELFEAIEKQTYYRIFCTPEVSDSLMVTVNETHADPLALIRKTLQDTEFRISVFQNAIYIIENRTLITALPENFHKRTSTESSANMPVFERETKANSEMLVYAVGNPNTPSTTRVTMTGVVTNFRTGETMPGITLMLEDPFIGTVTDAFGFYSIRLPPGRQELIIRGMGIKNSKRQLMLFSDGKLDIEIQEQIYSLGEVTIMADRTDNIRSVSGMERLQMKSIKNVPTILGEADILRVVMTLPGVKAAGEVSSGFNVRGGATDQNLILFNDGTIYAPMHLFGLFSAFNPDIVDHMELYKSGIPAKYGGRLSSVLEIRSKDGNKKEFQGTASLGLLTSRLSLESPFLKGQGSFIVGGRTTYSDWMLGLIPEKSGYSNGTAGFHDLTGSANYKIDDKNIVYLNGYYSRNRFSFTNKDEYWQQNANFSARWRHAFNPKFTSVYAIGHDHYSHSSKDARDIFNAFSLNFALNQMFGRADFTYYLNNEHTLNFGITSTHYRLDPGHLLPAHESSMIKEDRLQTEKSLESAVYISDQWEISPRWLVDAGMRYSMFNVLGPRIYNTYLPGYLPSLATVLRTDTAGSGVLKTWHGPEFRLSGRYIINENTSVKAGINTMQQYIHKISNSTTMAPTDVWKLSDVNIRPQTGVQYVAGLFRNFLNNTIETSVEAYYKTMNNYLDYRGGAELLMSPHIETEVAGVKGRAYGVELMLKKPRGRLNGWMSYTWSRTMLHRHEELASSANSSNWYPSDFDKPHEIKFVGNFKFTHRYSLSMNLDYSTGRPITLPVSKYWYEGQQYVYYAERNKYRVPDFFRIDVSFNIEAGHRLSKLFHAYFNIGVYNLTGRKNPFSVYYVLEEGRIQGYTLSVFGAPIPYASLNIKF
ncbi:MAG: TonB-dependent receptor [Bacteroidales bacterium]|nr:TonB-dependent receptor [Bacteroidales bacterium]